MTTATQANSLAIEARGLVKVFGKNRAVDGVDLRVPAGSIYGVLGPNGAGKTTTINMLATLMRPDGGTAHVFGHDVAKHPHIVRQLIGVTGQYASLDETLSAIENLTIFGRLLGLSTRQAKAKGAQLLDEFGLADAAKRQVKTFSGGMRRRLDLASSLISQPPLIFLDEPTTGLDPRTRAQMWGTIRELVANGSTILLTTQYLDEADQLADRIAVIDRGRVVAEGTGDELKSSVGELSLEITISDAERIGEALQLTERATGTVPQLSAEAGRLSVPLHDADQAGDVLAALRGSSIHIAELTVTKPSLDAVFLALTGHGQRDAAHDRTDDTDTPADAAPETDTTLARSNA